MLINQLCFHRDFNPRTHRGVRQKLVKMIGAFRFISIHAPIVGCDLNAFHLSYPIAYFNPRTHRGVRLFPFGQIDIYLLDFNPRTHRGVRRFQSLRHDKQFQFQSTHPSWGATQNENPWVIFSDISIHAPIVGCDLQKSISIIKSM